jgi:hypothetical protein
MLMLIQQNLQNAGSITGSLAATEAADVFAGTGGVVVAGSLAGTELADVFAASGTVTVSGSLSGTELADTFAASGTVTVSGSLAATEAADTFAATGTVVFDVTGALAATEDLDVFSASGTVPDIIGIDTHDGFDTKKKFKKEVDAKERKKRQLVNIYEELVEARPAIAAAIVEPFTQKIPETLAKSIDFDALLGDLDRVQSLYREMQEIDDEEVLLLL